MTVEGLACCVVGLRQFCVAVIFTDEHPESVNGLPLALIRGCTVARSQAELAGLLSAGAEPAGVQVYVEPDATQAEMCSLWMAGFRVRMVRLSEVLAVPGWWHVAAHRHHAALTRQARAPHSAGAGGGKVSDPLSRMASP
jgi:hypothetical protein